MKKIKALGFLLFCFSQLSFAMPLSQPNFTGPVVVTIDFWNSAPFVYDGHIVVSGELSFEGKFIEIYDGTIELSGNKYAFNLDGYLSDQTSSGWDYIIGNFDGSYVDASGTTKTAWAHIEGFASTFYDKGILDAESFVYADLDNLKWSKAILSVVSVPEPTSIALLFLGLSILGWKRRFNFH